MGALALLVSLGGLAAATPTYALVVGNNAPPEESRETDLAPLRYADDDAARFYRLFEQLGFDDVRLLAVLDAESQRRYPQIARVAREPSLAQLSREVDDLARRVAKDKREGRRPVFYLVYSGHGARRPDGNAFLSLLDGVLTREVLYDDVLRRIDASQSHLIVDACQAGGVVGVRGELRFEREVEATVETVTATEAEDLANPLRAFPTVGALVATSLGQEAHEWSRLESGVFTHEVLSGLRGAADVNGDGTIEYSEIHAFVTSANRAVENPRATPRIIARPPAIDHHAPLIRVGPKQRSLFGRFEQLGHFHLSLANGVRYLDAHLGPGFPARLLLPEDARIHVRTADVEAEIEAGADHVDLDSLQFRPIASRARGPIDAAYRRALFRLPYSRDYYEGFVAKSQAPSVRFGERAPVPTVSASADDDLPEYLGTVAMWGAVTTGLVTVATSALAAKARHDFASTNVQREADDAAARFHLSLGVAITSAVVTAGLVVVWRFLVAGEE